ncbi:thyrotropin subunit beta-like precursor [Callorhinchus milii]|uniref:Thyrotropin subunit beta n=1 Tax=Callorhinchus milii TaxID=7868 RepID=F1BZW0_CALMI|nr:thyrotropin subunit beta-like precursor [Callorhinchus milii]ADX01334.1 thyroid-stimulating hormone beta subunit 1 [Callorhinchus milii]|eukprot:gi/632955700/ref/XP_007893591.1/ PREDICTED: thyrotropin subunit beta-like [Callorhinchus milii]
MNAMWLLPLVLCLSGSQIGFTCSLTRHVVYVEKEECSYCMAINTTVCAGYCMSRDVNIKTLLPKNALVQNVCTFHNIRYMMIRLPGCPPDIDPFYRLPVVLSCQCSQCATETTDCTNDIANQNPYHCTKPQWRIPATNSRIFIL